jgi:hypothetical protein
MTAELSAAEGEPARRHQQPPSAGQSSVPLLDVLLRAGRRPGEGGSPADLGGDGFAALRFDATPASVTRTRGFLRSTLTGWRLPELVEDATCVGAELVANAVTHALRPPGPAARLPAESTAWIALLRVERAVVCAVADPSPALPALTAAEPFAESGRGLRIVAELSETWGHSAPEPAGKTVWARLRDHTWEWRG